MALVPEANFGKVGAYVEGERGCRERWCRYNIRSTRTTVKAVYLRRHRCRCRLRLRRLHLVPLSQHAESLPGPAQSRDSQSRDWAGTEYGAGRGEALLLTYSGHGGCLLRVKYYKESKPG